MAYRVPKIKSAPFKQLKPQGGARHGGGGLVRRAAFGLGVCARVYLRVYLMRLGTVVRVYLRVYPKTPSGQAAFPRGGVRGAGGSMWIGVSARARFASGHFFFLGMVWSPFGNK